MNMEKQALHVSDTCLSKNIFESRWTPRFLIDVWSLIGEPASETVPIDSAKAARGLDLGLWKAMASDLDGLKWRPLFKSQSWTLLSAGFNWSNLRSQRWQGLWWFDQVRWSRVLKGKLGWNQGDIVYFQRPSYHAILIKRYVPTQSVRSSSSSIICSFTKNCNGKV